MIFILNYIIDRENLNNSEGLTDSAHIEKQFFLGVKKAFDVFLNLNYNVKGWGDSLINLFRTSINSCGQIEHSGIQ